MFRYPLINVRCWAIFYFLQKPRRGQRILLERVLFIPLYPESLSASMIRILPRKLFLPLDTCTREENRIEENDVRVNIIRCCDEYAISQLLTNCTVKMYGKA